MSDPRDDIIEMLHGDREHLQRKLGELMAKVYPVHQTLQANDNESGGRRICNSCPVQGQRIMPSGSAEDQ